MPSVAEYLIDQIKRRSKHVFALPGDFIINFINKLYKTDLEVVVTTTEAAAGYAADAYARVNGFGVCCVTYCVGGFNLLNAIAGAKAESSPVVVIGGSPGIKERNSKVLLHHMVGTYESQHEMYSKITCANTVLRDPDRAGYEIDRVLNACMHHKQPVYIELPRDIIDKPIRYDAFTIGTPRDAVSDEHNLAEALGEVTEWINGAKKPVIWAGVEVSRYGLGKAIMKFAEETNIPIATTVLGKSTINERHPLSLGVYCESTATDEMRDIVENSDCLIMLGVMMTDVNLGFLPSKYLRRNIILSTSQVLQVRNHSYEDVNFTDFVGGLTKAKITKKGQPRCIKPKDNKFTPEKNKKITTARVMEKINSILNSNMAIVADVGDALFGALDITVHDSNLFLSDAFYASMGFSVPGALGVQTAKPNIRPIVLVGDGAFQMTGMEFSTLVRRKLNPIIFVLNNGGYGTERLILDGPYNDIQNWNYEKVPLIVGGGQGFKVTTEEELENVVATALDCAQPTIINVVLDANDHTPALTRMFGRRKT